MEVTVEKLDNFGRGITYINDKICFIENALPKEVVDIKIIEDKKKYCIGKVIEYIETSPNRIEEECPYSTVCGGCQLNHICFNDENKFKKDKVKSLLKKMGHIETPISSIKYHERNHYRNKIILHGKDHELGLYKKETNEIIPIQSCLLVNDKINEIINQIRMCNDDIEECIIKTSNDNSSVLVSIKGSINHQEELKKIIDVLEINGKILTDKKSIITTIGNKKYYESTQSFFQVNNTLTKELYDCVLEEVKKKHYKNALDLYCGTGTIGIYISDYVGKIIGIDNNPSNIKDANKNKELNHCENINFIEDSVENKIDSFHNIELIIVDPPRTGLDPKTIEYLLKINPVKIIYVSCDPVTLSRDLDLLQSNYNIQSIQLFNMFPRTYHCESVCILERR